MARRGNGWNAAVGGPPALHPLTGQGSADPAALPPRKTGVRESVGRRLLAIGDMSCLTICDSRFAGEAKFLHGAYPAA